MRTRTRIVAAVLVATMLATVLSVLLLRERQRLYKATLLPSLGGDMAAATGINDRGQVTGFAQTPDGVFHFFLWDREHGMEDLGPAPLRMATSCWINNQGLAVGQFGSASQQEAFSAWTRERGLQRVHSLENASVALAGLNDANQILVNTFRRGIRISRFRFFSKAGSYLCDPNGACTAVESLLADRKSLFHNATDINNRGCLVGFLATPSIGWNGAILEPIRERARE